MNEFVENKAKRSQIIGVSFSIHLKRVTLSLKRPKVPASARGSLPPGRSIKSISTHLFLFAKWKYSSIFASQTIEDIYGLTDIFDESVIAFILVEESRQFQRIRDKQHTRHLVWIIVPDRVCHTGVEYCLFDARQSRASPQINDSAPHFFLQ